MKFLRARNAVKRMAIASYCRGILPAQITALLFRVFQLRGL